MAVGRAGDDHAGVHRLDDALGLAHPYRDAGELDGHLGLDVLVEGDADEVEVDDVAPHRVPLQLAGHRQVLLALHLQVDEGVETGLGVQDGVEVAAVHGHRAGLEAVPVYDGGHPAVAPQAAGRARALDAAGITAQGHLFHGESSSTECGDCIMAARGTMAKGGKGWVGATPQTGGASPCPERTPAPGRREAARRAGATGMPPFQELAYSWGVKRVAWVVVGLIVVVGASSACSPDASVTPTTTAGTTPPATAPTTSSTQGIVPSSTTTATVTSTTSTILPTYADARVVPVEANPGTTEEPLPFPEAVLEPVGQEEIDAGLGDLVRRLAWEEETARPTWQMAYWGEIQDIEVIGRVAGILLFKTHPAQEGICVHAYDGAQHLSLCDGTDGHWTMPLGTFAGDGEGQGAFVLLITYSGAPWVAVEGPGVRRAQASPGSVSAIPLALTESAQTVHVFGPSDEQVWVVDWEVTVNGTTEPGVPPDLTLPGAASSVAGWEFVPSAPEGHCTIPVEHGALPCVGEIWRRVTFADPDVSFAMPAFWQAGVDATGIRLSSAVEEVPYAATGDECLMGGVALLSVDPNHGLLHLEVLEDASGLPPRPDSLSWPPDGDGVKEYLPPSECAHRLHMMGYLRTFADQGSGFRLTSIYPDEVAQDLLIEVNRALALDHILDSFRVEGVARPEETLTLACGDVEAPYAESPPPPWPLGPEGEEWLALLAGAGEGQWLVENYEWGLWEESADRLVLLGRARPGADVDGVLTASAAFRKAGEAGWVWERSGQCRWTVVSDLGVGAEWVLDPAYPVRPTASEVHLLVTERSCAGGQVPEGRAVTPVVLAPEWPPGITIIVLIEPPGRPASCLTNPPFELTVDVGHPIGGGPLLDGGAIPAPVRYP